MVHKQHNILIGLVIARTKANHISNVCDLLAMVRSNIYKYFRHDHTQSQNKIKKKQKGNHNLIKIIFSKGNINLNKQLY